MWPRDVPVASDDVCHQARATPATPVLNIQRAESAISDDEIGSLFSGFLAPALHYESPFTHHDGEG
jgi:hypothetical protein